MHTSTAVETPPVSPRRPSSTEPPTRRRIPARKTWGYLAMAIALLIIGLPLYWILITSFKERADVYVQPVTWWPSVFHPQNYADATGRVPFTTFLRNSLIITTTLAVIKFVLGILSAYALVFLRFPGKTIVFLTVIAALMVPNQITVISNYALVAEWDGAIPSRA